MFNHANNCALFHGDSRNQVVAGGYKSIDNIPRFDLKNVGEFEYGIELNVEKTWGKKELFESSAIIDSRNKRNDKLLFHNSMVHSEFYTTSDIFEFLLKLWVKPSKPEIWFDVDEGQIEWHRQPPLTEQSDDFIAEHGKYITITDTHVFDKEGNIITYRPKNIVNGYALYCPKRDYVKGKTNYMAGKVGELENPYFILADGTKLKTAYEYKKGSIRVEIPLDLYNNWKWGIEALVLDPTFGYTATAATGYNWNSRLCHIGSTMLYTATTGDTITKFSVLAMTNGSDFNVEVAAYDMDGSTPPNPVNRLALGVTVVINSETKGWFDSAAVSQAMANAVKYGVGWVSESTSYQDFLYYDSGAANNYSICTGTGTPLPATWTESSTSGARWAIYATYTAGGAAAQLSHVDGRTIAEQTIIRGLNKTDIGTVEGYTIA
jgi:hypothetical protein